MPRVRRQGRRRAELEIRAVLVSWRDVMADIRAGLIPESRQSVRALAMLDDIERKHGDELAEIPLVTSQLFARARSEIQGGANHARDWKAAQ